jgi:hypothetical protein
MIRTTGERGYGATFSITSLLNTRQVVDVPMSMPTLNRMLFSSFLKPIKIDRLVYIRRLKVNSQTLLTAKSRPEYSNAGILPSVRDTSSRQRSILIGTSKKPKPARKKHKKTHELIPFMGVYGDANKYTDRHKRLQQPSTASHAAKV